MTTPNTAAEANLEGVGLTQPEAFELLHLQSQELAHIHDSGRVLRAKLTVAQRDNADLADQLAAANSTIASLTAENDSLKAAAAHAAAQAAAAPAAAPATDASAAAAPAATQAAA